MALDTKSGGIKIIDLRGLSEEKMDLPALANMLASASARLQRTMREACSYTHARHVVEDADRVSEEDLDGHTYEEARAAWAPMYEKQKARTDHALRRLRAKGLYSASCNGLMALAQERGLDDAVFGMRILIYSVLHDAPLLEIADDTWRSSIEYTMFQRNKDLYLDPDALWGREIEQHVDLLFPTVLMMHACGMGLFLHDRLSKFFYGSGLEHLVESLLGAVDENNNLGDAVRAMSSEADALRRTIAAKDEEIRRLRRELDAERIRAQRTEARLEHEAAALRDMIGSDPGDGPDDETDGVAAVVGEAVLQAEDGDAGEDLPELPETGVLFVGGHVHLHNILRRSYPKWTFLGSRDVNAPMAKRYKCAFVWYKSLAHKCFWRVRSELDGSTPMLYLNATNVPAMMREMREQWALCSDRRQP